MENPCNVPPPSGSAPPPALGVQKGVGTPRLWEAPARCSPPRLGCGGTPKSYGTPPAVPAPPWGAWVEPHGGEVHAPPKQWGPPHPQRGCPKLGGVPQSRVRTPKWSGCPKTGCGPQSRGGTPVPKTLPALGTGISGAPQTTIKNWGSSGALSFVLPELPRAHRGVRSPTKHGGQPPQKIGRSPPAVSKGCRCHPGGRTHSSSCRASSTNHGPLALADPTLTPLFFGGGRNEG